MGLQSIPTTVIIVFAIILILSVLEGPKDTLIEIITAMN